ncbi:TPA: hypothetical protein I7E55_001990 [Vibrio cholerae]|nr:hypothetical protein [Vibrio cholerae]
MNKDAVWFFISLIGAALGFWILCLNANIGSNITAGITIFLAGWSACYRSGRYLNIIKG